jgi:hypothetical protein
MLTMGVGGCFTDGSNQENEGDRTMTWLVRYQLQYTQSRARDSETMFFIQPRLLSCTVLSVQSSPSYNSLNAHFQGNGFNFEILSLGITAFWNVAPCSLVEFDRSFRGACCLHHLQHRQTSTTLHDPISQKPVAFILAALRMWNLSLEVFQKFSQSFKGTQYRKV